MSRKARIEKLEKALGPKACVIRITRSVVGIPPLPEGEAAAMFEHLEAEARAAQPNAQFLVLKIYPESKEGSHRWEGSWSAG